MSHICFRSALPLVVLILTARVSTAQALAEPARELARRIAQSAGAAEVFRFNVRNASSLDPPRVAQVERALELELLSHRVRLGRSADAGPAIEVTLSENTSRFVWVAEIRQGEKREVVMVGVPRPEASDMNAGATSMAIETTLLLEREEPILDVAASSDTMLVLGPDNVSFFSHQDNGWELRQSLAIRNAKPLPRDLRGRLLFDGSSFQAYLPGPLCAGTTQPVLGMDCENGGARWPLGLADAGFAGKNFFEKKGLPPFFSVAAMQDRDTLLWLFAGLDRQIHFYDADFHPAGTLGGWGSDIASVESGCGIGRQVLATGAGGSTQPDTIQAFEIVGRQAVAVSPSVRLPGAVTALWQAEHRRKAVAVARDLHSGRYAAYSLAVSCGH